MENIAASILDIGGPELLQQVMDELKSGIELQRMKTEAQVQSWSENTTRTSKAVEGFGYCEMEVPADIYFNWGHYEKGFWGDPASRKWFLNKNPQFRVKYERKPQSGYTAPLQQTASGLFIGTKYGAVTGQKQKAESGKQKPSAAPPTNLTQRVAV